jgi:hypothetical protein
MDELAPMLVLLTLILTTGGVILFRPLAKRLGDLLEIMAQQRRAVTDNSDTARIRQVVETLDARIALLEERQDFTDALLSASRTGAAGPKLAPEPAGSSEATGGAELQDRLPRGLPGGPVS